METHVINPDTLLRRLAGKKPTYGRFTEATAFFFLMIWILIIFNLLLRTTGRSIIA